MANPNQNQPEEPELKPIDLHDEPLPVLKANAEGEGDDAVTGEQPSDENEGEGSRSADRNYREGVKKHLKKGGVQKEAKDAEQALDDEQQRKDLEEAEKAAREGRTH